MRCSNAPEGWICFREVGHDGPCSGQRAEYNWLDWDESDGPNVPPVYVGPEIPTQDTPTTLYKESL